MLVIYWSWDRDLPVFTHVFKHGKHVYELFDYFNKCMLSCLCVCVFLFKQPFIMNPENINLQVCLHVKKENWSEENPCRLLGSNQPPLSQQVIDLTNVVPTWIYSLPYVSVTLHNIIYLFNINSRKIDGHYRSWVEYLNERCNVCIINRSIKWDKTLQVQQRAWSMISGPWSGNSSVML